MYSGLGLSTSPRKRLHNHSKLLTRQALPVRVTLSSILVTVEAFERIIIPSQITFPRCSVDPPRKCAWRITVENPSPASISILFSLYPQTAILCLSGLPPWHSRVEDTCKTLLRLNRGDTVREVSVEVDASDVNLTFALEVFIDVESDGPQGSWG